MLARTNTTVRLKSNDGLFYTVRLADKGDDIIVPEADETTGAAGITDPFISILGDDDIVYRWSLESKTVTTDDDSWVQVESVFEEAEDQSEEALDGLDLELDGVWYKVILIVKPDGDGEMIPGLETTDGEPWVPEEALFAGRLGVRWSVPVFGARWSNH